jgi:hypothetical protein
MSDEIARQVSADDQWKAYLQLVSEEYKTIRDEALRADQNTFTALQWGGTLIGIAAAAGFSQGCGSFRALCLCHFTR